MIPRQWQVVTTRNTPQPPTWATTTMNTYMTREHKDNVDGVTSSNEQKEEHNRKK